MWYSFFNKANVSLKPFPKLTKRCDAGRHEHIAMAGDANTNVPHLYHTMSALVSQRQASPRVSAPGMPIRASLGTGASPANQSHSVSPSRLTEALLAAADDVTSSAEKLPVSHRLPVSRSVFDSDEGKTSCCYANYLDNYQGSSVCSSCTCQNFAWSPAMCRHAATCMHGFVWLFQVMILSAV